MPEMANLFTPDAFNLQSMTAAVNTMPFVPGRVGQLGVFEESGIPTTVALVESQDGVLGLLSPRPRGGPGETSDKTKRKLRAFPMPHFQHDDGIMADEVQGVREFGTTSALRSLQAYVNSRVAEKLAYLDATLEYQRIGAIKGIITYADSSSMNLFTEFGVTQETEIDFNLDAATDTGAIRKNCAAVTRLVSRNLGNLPFSGLHAFCGDAFFDGFISNVEVRNSYLSSPVAPQLRAAYVASGMSYGSFDFGGITWENYRGAVGGQAFVHTDKCHIFPTGVPGLFKTWFAPADYNETVNTIGLPRYVKPIIMDNDKGVRVEIQSNPLSICLRPKALILGKRT